MRGFCRGIHACEVPVLALGTHPDARRIVTEACRAAVEADASDAIVLGCASMADLCAQVRAEVGVPVVDGVAAATPTVQSLLTLGLRKSGRGEFATPPLEPYTGSLRSFGA
jgi:allantoin racemase